MSLWSETSFPHPFQREVSLYICMETKTWGYDCARQGGGRCMLGPHKGTYGRLQVGASDGLARRVSFVIFIRRSIRPTRLMPDNSGVSPHTGSAFREHTCRQLWTHPLTLVPDCNPELVPCDACITMSDTCRTHYNTTSQHSRDVSAYGYSTLSAKPSSPTAICPSITLEKAFGGCLQHLRRAHAKST